MVEKKNEAERQASDYKARFEFRFYVGNSIICQRYFKIGNFNPQSINSVQLIDTMKYCANLIDENLKSKSRIYSWYLSPQVLNNEEELEKWVSNPNHTTCENIILRNHPDKEYVFNPLKDNKITEYDRKLCDGELIEPVTDNDYLSYKLSFCDNGKEVISRGWEGLYPKYVRRNVDLTNRRGKFSHDDLSKLPFESYLMFCLVDGKEDLTSKIVKEICATCSDKIGSYTTVWDGERYDSDEEDTRKSSEKGVSLKFNPYVNYADEIAEANKYYRQNGIVKQTGKGRR